ncbi:MAG: hypothetical protein WBO37_03760 [Gammaproteobacteria bacterium]
MLHRTGFLVIMLACCSFTPLTTGLIDSAHASQNNEEVTEQPAPNKIHGEVTDIIEAGGYTYAEVDTGKEKVWAAATSTPLKIGDTVAFTTEMPMENFHSTSMNRDFPIVYFVSRFITDKAEPTGSTGSTGTTGTTGTTTAMASPHDKIKPASAATPVEGISKVEGGNTIAEVYTDKQQLDGKTVRVRGKVTKFTAGVMGRNWLHIRDSSTLDDLTVTTDSTSAIDAVVVIEGKLALDKDFGFGYVYPLLVEDATVTKE